MHARDTEKGTNKEDITIMEKKERNSKKKEECSHIWYIAVSERKSERKKKGKYKEIRKNKKKHDLGKTEKKKEERKRLQLKDRKKVVKKTLQQ